MKILNLLILGIVLQITFIVEHNEPQINRQQAISIEVGFVMGSKLALIALPLGMRNKSFAGISHNMADLEILLSELQINHSDLMQILDRVNAAIIENSPSKAADKLFEGANRLNELLRSKNTDLMHTNRIGFVLGYISEMASIMLTGKLQKRHLEQFNISTQKWRTSILDDIKKSKLSPQAKEKIRKTNREANTVADLKDIKIGCIEILNTAQKNRQKEG